MEEHYGYDSEYEYLGVKLIVAAEGDDVKMVKMLLNHNEADVNFLMEGRKTALLVAAENENIEVIRYLLEVPNLDINQFDDDGWTALIWAVELKNKEIVKMLLEIPDVDVNQSNDEGETPLMIAANENFPEIAELLVQRKDLDVNKKDLNGRTALSKAIGNDEMVKILLDAGAIDENGELFEYAWGELPDHYELYLLAKGDQQKMDRVVNDILSARKDDPKVVDQLIAIAAEVNDLEALKFFKETFDIKLSTVHDFLGGSLISVARMYSNDDLLNYITKAIEDEN